MDLPTAGNTSTLGPVGTTVQALRIPSPSSNIPQRTPIGALLLAVSRAPTPTRPQLLHTPSITADIIAEGASCCLSPPCPSCPCKSISDKLTEYALSDQRTPSLGVRHRRG